MRLSSGRLTRHSLCPSAQRLSDTGAALPLEELFLEGPCVPEDLAVLVDAIARLPALRRLALYQVHEPKPALVADLARAAPQVEALTLVAGDCQEAVEWAAPLVRAFCLLPRSGLSSPPLLPTC